MLVTDTATLTGTRRTRDGYLVVDALIARTGIQIYAGSEMGEPTMDTVRVFRPEAEVFSDRALVSFAHRPVTSDHPAQMVTAETWRDTAVGTTGDTVTRDGEFVRVPFTLMDAATIKLVDEGKRELSAGYTATIEWTPGTTPGGEAYDAVMTGIHGNHLAIVSKGRAGASCRIGDAWTAPKPNPTPKENRTMPDNLRAVLVDGISIQSTDQGAQAIEKLQAQLADAQRAKDGKEGQIAALTSKHTGAISAKDGEIAALASAHTTSLSAKDGEIAALQARIPDTAALDALIESRSGVIAAAKRALGDAYDPKGKTAAEMQMAVVTHRLGDAAVAGRPPEFIAAAFDTLALADAAPGGDPLRAVLRDGMAPPNAANAVNDAARSYDDRISNAWKGAK